MNHQAGVYVSIKGIGAAKIDDVLQDSYFLFHADGKCGGGWKDHEVERVITDKVFWAEWRRHRASN